MNMEENKFIKNLLAFAKLSAWIIIIVGLIVMLGWAFNIASLKSILPSFVSMKSNTAFAFILSGISLLFLQKANSKTNKVVGQGISIVVVLVGALTLIEYGFHVNFGIDQFIFKEDTGAILTASPGRMSAISAFCFFIVGLSLLFYNSRFRKTILPSQLLSLLSFIIALLGLFGYIYSQWDVLQVMGSTLMALHTAFLFLILSLGIFISQPHEGFMKKITSETSGGKLLRYLIPLIFIFPLLVESFTKLCLVLGLFDQNLEQVFHSFILIAILSVLAWLVIAKYELTESKEKQSEERFRSVFENSPLGKSMTGVDGSLHVNKSFCMILGYTEAEIKAKKWQEITHPDDIQESTNIVQSLIKGEKSKAKYEKRYLHKNGDIVWSEVNTTLLRDENNEPLYFITSISDITERKQAESRLQLEKDRIRTILDLVGDPIFVKDNDHRITMANRAFYDIFGLNEKSVIGYTLVETVPENERHQFLEVDRKVLDTGITDIREEELTTGDLTRTIITRKTRFIDQSGKKILVGSIHDITDKKQFENRILQQVEYANQLIDSLPGLFYQISPEGKFTKWNKNFEIVSGYSSVEMGAIRPLDLFEGEDKIQIEKNINKVFTGGNTTVEAKLITKKGTKIPFYFTGKLINIDNNPLLVGMGMDISEQKDAELKLKESEEKYRLLIKSTPLPLCLVDNAGNLVYINDRFKRDFGYNLADIPTLDEWWKKAYPDEKYRSWVLDTWNKAIENARLKNIDIESVEYKVTCKNEKERIIIISGITLEDGFLATFIDITDRKQAEEKLSESEEKFRHAFNEASIGRAIAGLDGEFIQINPAMCKTLGYTKAELLTKSWMDITHPDSLENSYNMTKKLMTNEIPSAHYDCMFNHKNGSLIWISLNLILTRDKDGNPLMFIGDLEDITERKNIEDRFRNAAENLSDVIYEWDLKDHVEWFGKIDSLMGYKEGEFPRTLSGWAALLHPEDLESVQQAIDNHLKNNTPYNIEYRVRRKNGSYLYWSARGNTLKDTYGKPIKWVGSISNITKHKNAEIALLESKEKLNLSLEGGNIGIWEWDIQANKILWDERMEKMFRLTPGTFSGDFEEFSKLLTPDSVELMQEAIKNTLENDAPYDIIVKELLDNNTTRYFNAKAKVYRTIEGIPIKMSGVSIDVTELKTAEEEKNRLIALIDQSPDFIGTADLQGNLLYHNSAAKRMVGLPENASMDGLKIENLCTKEVLDLVINEGIPTALKEGVWQSEIALKHVDGHEIPVSNVLMVHRDSNGNPLYTSTIMRDISNLKQIEKKLKSFNSELERIVLERTLDLQRNEKFLNETGSLAKVGGWEIDLKANKVNWTNEVYQIHETSPEEHQPTVESGINFYTPEAIPIISEAVGKAISDGIPFDLELQIITAKKNKKWVRAVGKAVAENSKVIKIIGAFQDINHQKLMEEELRIHRDQLEELVKEKTFDLTVAINNLERSNQELESFNKMAVGREKRMIELKGKINMLSRELGKEAPYDLSFAIYDNNTDEEAKG